MRNWKKYLEEYEPSHEMRHEEVALRACMLAIRASELHTYGVGAVLLDERGDVIVEGHNEVYVSGFRSDLHAEMVVMNKFESAHGRVDAVEHYTLVTSLEPCPMCMTRLIFSGIGTILHVRADDIGGMVQRKSSLPPIFKEITESNSQVWGMAECSDTLREAAFHIWDQSRHELDRRLKRRRDRAQG